MHRIRPSSQSPRACLLWFAAQAVQLARFKYFTLDEFQYAHAAWLVAQRAGAVPRLLRGALPAGLSGPGAGVPRRGRRSDGDRRPAARHAAVARSSRAARSALLNRRHGALAALAGPLLLLALPPFVTLATEIRPDATACALFLASLAVLRLARASDRVCGFASGLLLVAAVWGSQKAAFYGSIYALALLADLAARRAAAPAAATGRCCAARPPSCAARPSGRRVVALYLTASGSWAAWWSWCFVWAAEHQRHYPGFSWRRYFDPILVDALWLFALAAWGLRADAARARRARTRRDARSRPPAGRGARQHLRLVRAAARALSVQLAAVPRGRDGVRRARRARSARRAHAPVAARRPRPWPCSPSSRCRARPSRPSSPRRTPGSSTCWSASRGSPRRPIAAYDNSGGYVARPHAYSYFYTDSFLRESLAETLARDVPRAIVERGAVLHLRDLRFDTLPAPLRAFLTVTSSRSTATSRCGDSTTWSRRTDASRTRSSRCRDDRYFVDAGHGARARRPDDRRCAASHEARFRLAQRRAPDRLPGCRTGSSTSSGCRATARPGSRGAGSHRLLAHLLKRARVGRRASANRESMPHDDARAGATRAPALRRSSPTGGPCCPRRRTTSRRRTCTASCSSRRARTAAHAPRARQRRRQQRVPSEARLRDDAGRPLARHARGQPRAQPGVRARPRATCATSASRASSTRSSCTTRSPT